MDDVHWQLTTSGMAYLDENICDRAKSITFKIGRFGAPILCPNVCGFCLKKLSTNRSEHGTNRFHSDSIVWPTKPNNLDIGSVLAEPISGEKRH